jgi:hypothetical protein
MLGRAGGSIPPTGVYGNIAQGVAVMQELNSIDNAIIEARNRGDMIAVREFEEIRDRMIRLLETLEKLA